MWVQFGCLKTMIRFVAVAVNQRITNCKFVYIMKNYLVASQSLLKSPAPT